MPRQTQFRSFVLRASLALVCALALGAIFPPTLLAQDGSAASIGVDASEQVFVTLCALDAAGFNADESTLGDMPERLALRADLLKLHGPATEAIRKYYSDHAVTDPGEMLSRYITFALVIGPPPRFTFQMSEDALPPEAVSLQDFQPLLEAFYKEANLEARWQKVKPEYDSMASAYRPILRGIVIRTNAYLREVLRPSGGRAFTVYVEPLAGSRTNFRNLGDHYAVVAGTRPADATDEIQHAYLHFLLDPLVLKDRNNVQTKRLLLDVAARAPELPEEYRTDFVSFTDECVVKAVELRLRNLPATQQETVLKEDDESGFVMVRPLVAQLQKFERGEPSMSYYFNDMIMGVDVAAEKKRLQGIMFANEAEAPAEPAAPIKPAQPGAVDREQLLAEGDRAIALHDGPGAADVFTKVLDADPNDSRALYGLAVASVLSGHADESRTLFEKVVANAHAGGAEATDPAALAWSHIYLGRMNDLEGSRDLAVNEYKAALAVNGAPESAQVAAQRGVDTAYAPPTRAGEGASQQP